MESIIFAALLLGTANSFDLSVFDSEACVTLPNTPIVRVINATDPTAFSSPGYNTSDPADSTYPANIQCQWSISTEPGNTLELIFFDFFIENSTDCTEEFVAVYDGSDDLAPLIRQLCGEVDQNPPIVANGTELFIRFFSNDDMEQETGFIARVGSPLEVTACNNDGPQVFTEPSGLFATENYPISYSSNAVCQYVFNAPVGQVIEISFSNFELAQNCNDDWLDIYDGPSLGFASFGGRFFGTMRPSKLLSATNNVYLKFESDGEEAAPGFIGSYKFITPQSLSP